MYADIERYISTSGRVDTAGVDLVAAARVGLSADELFVLTYFADVENQSLRYLRTLLGMKVAYQPDVSAFLATWNYEEFFHGYELEQLMRACGHEPGRDRRELKRRSARWNERLEALLIPLLSHFYEEEFPAVYMAFGAIQELTTLRGYEQLARHTQNPALALLCERIAKQERRHFAWYFNSAQALLSQSKRAQRLTARLLKLNWVPVGAGVHTAAEVERLFRILFYPRERAQATIRAIDSKIATLPGLSHLQLMHGYCSRAGVV
jgi:hypothetical protein